MRYLDEIRAALEGGRVSRRDLAAAARVPKSTINNLLKPGWNPRVNTVNRVYEALEYLESEKGDRLSLDASARDGRAR